MADILALLTDPGAWLFVRRQAAETLAELDDPRALEALAAIATDPSLDRRDHREARKALTNYKRRVQDV